MADFDDPAYRQWEKKFYESIGASGQKTLLPTVSGEAAQNRMRGLYPDAPLEPIINSLKQYYRDPKNIVNTLLDFIPGVGDFKSGIEAVVGETATGEPLSWWERLISGAGALPLVPSAMGIMKGMKSGGKVSKVLKETPKTPEGGIKEIIIPRKEFIQNTSPEYIKYHAKEKAIWDGYRKTTDPLFQAQDLAEKKRDWDTVFQIRRQVDEQVRLREERLSSLGEKIPGQIEKIHYDEFPTRGIRNYDLSNQKDAEELLSTLSRLDGQIGVRGIYKKEIGKRKLKPSSAWDDNSPTSIKLGGTSALYVGETSDFRTIGDVTQIVEKDISAYGDTGIKAIIFSRETLNPHEIYSDVGESVFPDAKVIGYINAKTGKSLPNLTPPAGGK